MSHRLCVLTAYAMLLASACSQPSEIETHCDTFCSGLVGCVRGVGCMPAGTEAELRSFCNSTCADIAITMTDEELDETLVCLACMDGEIDADTCQDPDLGVAAGTTCLLPCGTPGPSYYLDRFSMALGDTTPRPFTCEP